MRVNLSVHRAAMHGAFKAKRELLIHNIHVSLNVQRLDDLAWTIQDIAARGQRLADVAAGLSPESTS